MTDFFLGIPMDRVSDPCVSLPSRVPIELFTQHPHLDHHLNNIETKVHENIS
jgi:hypothetical protein